MKRLLLFGLSLAAFAAVDGRVVNRTTGKPQPGAKVTLFKLGQGAPEPLESVASDARGRFRFTRTPPPGPCLIETTYAGVTYNHMLPPGSPTTNLELEVFDSSSRPGSAELAQHAVLLEPVGTQLSVREIFVFKNDGKLTFNDPGNPALRFFLPGAAKDEVRVTATTPQGMPIQRTPRKTGQPSVYALPFPIKPGETRFEVTYTLPLSDPPIFSGKTFYPGVPTELVVPSGLVLQGQDLEPLGRDPRTQASIYRAAVAEYQAEIQEAADEDTGSSPQPASPRVYQRLAWILVPAFLSLTLGFMLHYRRTTARP